MYFDAESLVEGNCYFLVGYFDNSLCIPEIETYIFVGKNLFPEDAGGKDAWYFQKPGTYLQHGPFHKLPPSEDYEPLMMGLDILEVSIKDLDGLSEFLTEIKKRIP
jgi:hypothetical protein